MKKIIATLIVAILLANATTASANGFRKGVITGAAIVTAIVLLNNAADRGNQGVYQPVYQEQMYQYVGADGGAAMFEGTFCINTPAYFPNGAIFSGWTPRDWQGMSYFKTINVAPGTYPAGCW